MENNLEDKLATTNVTLLLAMLEMKLSQEDTEIKILVQEWITKFKNNEAKVVNIK